MPPRRSDQSTLDKEELWRRANAFAEALAALARLDPKVQEFRTEYLDGRKLTEEEALTFCRSRVLQCFARKDLVKWGVPLIGHTATIEEERRSRLSAEGDGEAGWIERITFRLSPPGIIREAKREYRPEVDRSDAGHTLNIAAPALEFPGERMVDRCIVWPCTVADDLRRLAVSLCKAYPFWHEYQAVWFLLRDKVPQVRPYSADPEYHGISDPPFGVIQLRLMPWISPEDVQQIYRIEQEKLVRKVRARDRDMGERSLAVFRFVVKQAPQLLKQDIGPTSDLPTWKALLSDWNQSCQREPEDWRYEGPQGIQAGFYRAFQRWKELLFPELRLPDLSFFRTGAESSGATEGER